MLQSPFILRLVHPRTIRWSLPCSGTSTRRPTGLLHRLRETFPVHWYAMPWSGEIRQWLASTVARLLLRPQVHLSLRPSPTSI
jgi:hypothetical protein